MGQIEASDKIPKPSTAQTALLKPRPIASTSGTVTGPVVTPALSHATLTNSSVENAVKTLASQVIADSTVISDDAIKSIEAVIAEIDKKLTEQVNLILHNEEFQKLESAWRGLSHLVNNTETDEMLKISQ